KILPVLVPVNVFEDDFVVSEFRVYLDRTAPSLLEAQPIEFENPTHKCSPPAVGDRTPKEGTHRRISHGRNVPVKSRIIALTMRVAGKPGAAVPICPTGK